MYKHRLLRIVVTSFTHVYIDGRWIPHDLYCWERRHFLGNPWLGVRSMGAGNFIVIKRRGRLNTELNRLPLNGEHRVEITRRRKGGGKRFPDTWSNGYQNIPGTPDWQPEATR